MHLLLLFLNSRVTKARKSLIIKLHRKLLLRSLEMNPVAFKTSTVVGELLYHGLKKALLLRSPTVHGREVVSFYRVANLTACKYLRRIIVLFLIFHCIKVYNICNIYNIHRFYSIYKV